MERIPDFLPQCHRIGAHIPIFIQIAALSREKKDHKIFETAKLRAIENKKTIKLRSTKKKKEDIKADYITNYSIYIGLLFFNKNLRNKCVWHK